eukprot:NODE_554_length_6117_cov_0.778498.p4 type:complete len:155 gc:universal NODE_554_length_6117_cov_0.778498:1291-1755(+)
MTLSLDQLSASCLSAFLAFSDCSDPTFTKPRKNPEIPSSCDTCKHLSDKVLSSCNENDFQSTSVWLAASQCHKEEGKWCQSPPQMIDVSGCLDKCAQFRARLSPFINDPECAAKYTPSSGGVKVTKSTKTTSKSSSSASSTRFTVLTLSTFLLF